MRGEYIREDGKVFRNQLTQVGMQALLKATFRHGSAPTWYMGFCMQIPQDSIALADVNEPDIGVGGYQRVALAFDSTAWPTIGAVNGETYVESINCSFPLTGALSDPVTRLFLTDGTNVMSISSPLAESPQVLSTPQNYKYRLYFR